MWLYKLPSFVICLFFAGLLSGAALAGHRLWTRFVRIEYDEEGRVLAIGMLGVVAMILSLLLAFSSITVWEAYSGAESAAASEASISGELARDLAVYGGERALAAREAVRGYLKSVIEDDWPAMAAGGRSEKASHMFNSIFRAVGALSPRNAREQALLAEIWTRTNELNVQRRNRLSAAEGSAVPDVLWGTILCSILLNCLIFYGMPAGRTHTVLLGLYSATLGLMLFFITMMDHPFCGSVSVQPGAYHSALGSMDRWDGEGR